MYGSKVLYSQAFIGILAGLPINGSLPGHNAGVIFITLPKTKNPGLDSGIQLVFILPGQKNIFSDIHHTCPVT
ncbi:MAG: hypothetical protein ACOY40_10850 [Bacillota bacterium]